MSRKPRTLNSYEINFALMEHDGSNLREGVRKTTMEWTEHWYRKLAMQVCDGVLAGKEKAPSQKALRVTLRAMNRYRKIAEHSQDALVIIKAQLKCFDLYQRHN